ncbi:MAG: HNH endonuclease [Clostridium sp.]|uniref:HNH endonuclease n=1 Tax=Clostridium sp. TaxID=1506 RepID=UPI002902254D|nr:HNH endonuclease [Clostridium sp.]MDU1586850.1 HNH endonuclease [Clostridium sp.]
MVIEFKDLNNADLIQDAIYKGGTSNNASSDPLIKLFKFDEFKKGIGVSGGFRKTRVEENGKVVNGKFAFVILLDTGKQSEWPNSYDKSLRIFTYYGDNNKAGHDIFKTKNLGNKFLYEVFNRSYNSKEERASIPPAFIFKSTGQGRDVKFIGLGVPGVVGKEKKECLRVENQRGIDNFVSEFTVLNIHSIKRAWLKDLKDKRKSNLSNNAPKEWLDFIENGFNSIQVNDYESIENIVMEKDIQEKEEGDIIQGYSENFEDEFFDNVELEEGEAYKKYIRIKERNKKVRKLKIEEFISKNGRVFCEVCGIDELVVLDVHHEKIKVSNMKEKHKTSLSDLRILCSNCHRKLHGYDLTFSELKKLLIKK